MISVPVGGMRSNREWRSTGVQRISDTDPDKDRYVQHKDDYHK